MDLAVGAKRIVVMMELMTSAGECKLVERCTYLLTGLGCVSRVYTDLAIFDLDRNGVRVSEMVSGLQLDELRRMTGLPALHVAGA